MKSFFFYFLIMIFIFYRSEKIFSKEISENFRQPIVADTNLYEIDVTSGFNGLELLIFIAKNNENDFFGNIIGPPKRYLVAKKEKFMGFWLKKKILFFNCVPSYYSFWILDEKPKMRPELMDFHQIGFNSLNFCIENQSNLSQDEILSFKNTLVLYMQKKKLFNGPNNSIKTNNNLIKISSFIPDNASIGNYLINLFTFSNENSKIKGQVKMSFFVRHLKLNKFLSNLNNYYPKIYVVFLFLVAGLNILIIRFILKKNK